MGNSLLRAGLLGLALTTGLATQGWAQSRQVDQVALFAEARDAGKTGLPARPSRSMLGRQQSAKSW